MGRSVRRYTSAALCRRFAASISTHGSKDESRTADAVTAPARGRPTAARRAEALRNARREFSMRQRMTQTAAQLKLRATKIVRRRLYVARSFSSAWWNGASAPRGIIAGMKRHFLALGAVAASLTIGAAAQTRAPQNDSITKDDLRADLFFFAGDSMRGRLTDTEENRA